MTQIQTLIETIFTSLILVIAGLALAAYTLLFYVVMIALEGYALCKGPRNRQRKQKNEGLRPPLVFLGEPAKEQALCKPEFWGNVEKG